MACEVTSTSRGQKSVQISQPLHNSSFISIISYTNTTETDVPVGKCDFVRGYYIGKGSKMQPVISPKIHRLFLATKAHKVEISK